MNNIFENLSIKLKDSNLTIEQKNELIKKAGEEYSKQIDNELNLYLTKQYIGAALQIGSAAIPLGNASQLGAKLGGQLLTKNLGRKLAQDIGSNAIAGGAGSAIYGLGKGISEEKNPILTATTDGILGFGTGAAIGGLTGTIEKNIFFQYLEYLKNHPEKIKKLNKKQITKDIKQYYKNYIQQTQDYKPEIGNIHYPAPGIKETITQQFKKALNIQNLKNNIKDSKYLGTEAPNHLRRKNDIKQFHRFQYKNEDYILAELNNGKINYYITKPNKKNPEETLTTISAASSGDGKIPSFININEYLQKNNPAQKINPQISILGTAAINNLINPANIETQSNTQSPVFKIGIEKQVFLPNEKYYSPDHIFTTQDIENMTTEEFTKYEPIIMEQLKHGMISQSPQNYKNYTNPISGENRIYTREDVESMTTNEFSELESQINAQINTIGLPATTDLEYANRFGDDIIYVNSYYRKDGTKVRGYYRSK